MIIDVALWILGMALVLGVLIAARYFWIMRPPVIWDVEWGCWRPHRGIHRQRGLEHHESTRVR